MPPAARPPGDQPRPGPPPAQPRARSRTATESRCPMPATTPPLPRPRAASDARCAALFASPLQPSDTPDAVMIAAAISSAVQRFGPRGCTERMAQEFGDHPDAAARRMRWARRLAAQIAPPRQPALAA